MISGQPIESAIPGLAELLAREAQNRAIAFAGLTRRVCGIELRAITPRDKLELHLLRNAFVTAGVRPSELDVFVLLWVLSPARRAPGVLGRLRALRAERRVKRLALRIPLARAIGEIVEFLGDQMQDAAEAVGSDGPRTDPSRWVHWVALDASFWVSAHGGFTVESYLSTPYLVLQQLFRAWRITHPRVSLGRNGEPEIEEAQFINRSDSLVGDFQRANSRAIADAIRAQTTRLP